MPRGHVGGWMVSSVDLISRSWVALAVTLVHRVGGGAEEGWPPGVSLHHRDMRWCALWVHAEGAVHTQELTGLKDRSLSFETHTSLCGAWLSLTLPAQGLAGPAHSEKTSVGPCICILVSIDGIFF